MVINLGRVYFGITKSQYGWFINKTDHLFEILVGRFFIGCVYRRPGASK